MAPRTAARKYIRIPLSFHKRIFIAGGNSKSRLSSHLSNKRKITDYDIEWLKKMQREYGRKLDWRTAVFLQMKVKGGDHGEHLDQSTTFGLPDSYFDAIRIHTR